MKAQITATTKELIKEGLLPDFGIRTGLMVEIIDYSPTQHAHIIKVNEVKYTINTKYLRLC